MVFTVFYIIYLDFETGLERTHRTDWLNKLKGEIPK